jgi:hypothetical protein
MCHPINPAKRISSKKVPAKTFRRTQLDYIMVASEQRNRK